MIAVVASGSCPKGNSDVGFSSRRRPSPKFQTAAALGCTVGLSAVPASFSLPFLSLSLLFLLTSIPVSPAQGFHAARALSYPIHPQTCHWRKFGSRRSPQIRT